MITIFDWNLGLGDLIPTPAETLLEFLQLNLNVCTGLPVPVRLHPTLRSSLRMQYKQ